jgi:hypothetical protein
MRLTVALYYEVFDGNHASDWGPIMNPKSMQVEPPKSTDQGRLIWERPTLKRLRAADADQHVFVRGSDDGHNQMS